MLLAPKSFDTTPPRSHARDATRLVAAIIGGGDARLHLDAQGRNQYYASAMPSDALAYGSSTISSISAHAFQTLMADWQGRLDRPLSPSAYADALQMLRVRLAECFGLHERAQETAIVFAASGTDLEYVGLAAALDARPLTAVLLGRDEVGSGCVHSAAGRFFADQTATGARVVPQTAIDPAFADVELIDVAVRDENGLPRSSAAVAAELSRHVDRAVAGDRQAVVHVVHGSKSGLTLPALDDVEAMAARFNGNATIVVDACQLRITPGMIRRYLDIGCIVLMTGSKFAGGPPFSGFALVPAAVQRHARPLPTGFRRLAARAEWPTNWPGADCLQDLSNPGLLLRLQAALIEIERFGALPADSVTHVIARFNHHATRLVKRLGLGEVPGAGGASCLASETLRTLDLSMRWPDCDFDTAKRMHADIARHSHRRFGREVRLGQPVKSHRLADGRAAGTLRLSLSMPMIAELAALPPVALDERLERDMAVVGAAISSAADTCLASAELVPSA